MRKHIGVFLLIGSTMFVSADSILNARGATAGPRSGRQAALHLVERTHALTRGDVLMPHDPLLVMMAERQEFAQGQYKAMSFKQKALIERFKPRKKLQQKERLTMHREIVAGYSPDRNGELQATLLSDSDRKAYQKYLKNKRKAQDKEEKTYQKYLKAKGKKGEAKAYRKYLEAKRKSKRKKSLAEKLISPILFPMTTVNVQKCKFTVLLTLPDMVLLRFEPEPMNMDPIFSGQVFVNPETGDIYRLEIDALYNFEKIEKRFKYVKRFNVAVDYIKQPGGYRFPSHMKERGFAKVLFFKGNFRFEIEESQYTRVKQAKSISRGMAASSGTLSVEG